MQLVKILYCKLSTTSKQLHTTVFSTYGSGFELLTSEMGGECVTTAHYVFLKLSESRLVLLRLDNS